MRKTPFKELQLRSTGTGIPFFVEGTVSFTKNNMLHPQKASHLKRKICTSSRNSAQVQHTTSFTIMTWQECLGGKIYQIWFGLIWINPKESKTQTNQRNQRNQKNKKQQNKTMFSRLVWTCLDPSSPQNFFCCFYCFFVFLVLFWVVNHSKVYSH